VIREVVDADRCGGLVFPGDVLVGVNDVVVSHWSHEDVVNALRACRSRRVARLTLVASRRGTAEPPPPSAVRRAPAVVPPRPSTAMAEPRAEPPPRVDYNQLYRQLYSPLPFARVTTRISDGAPAVTPDGGPDVALASRSSAPPTPDLVGAGSRRHGAERQRKEPRRSLPAPLSPAAAARGGISREPSTSSLNFSGTPDFIPASAYLEDDDRRRRATGRPSVEHELAALTLNDGIFGSAKAAPAARGNDDSFQSFDTDEASLPSSGSGLPPPAPAAASPTARAAFVGAGSETCNGYNTRTAAAHSAAAAARYRGPPAVERHRQRSQSALADPLGPGTRPHRGPGIRSSTDDDHEQRTAAVKAAAKTESGCRHNADNSPAPGRLPELTESSPESHSVAVVAREVA